MSLALAAGSPLAGGLRSQTCSPGWLASLIKEDRFLASFPPSLSSFFFFLPWTPAGESGASLLGAGGERGRAPGTAGVAGAVLPGAVRRRRLPLASSVLGMRGEAMQLASGDIPSQPSSTASILLPAPGQ